MAEIYKWHGFSELEKNLEMLGEQMRARGVRLMMSRASVPIRDEAKVRAPILQESVPHRMPGTIMRNIKIWRHKRTPFAVTYFVGVRKLSGASVAKFKKANKGKSGGQNPNDPYYWRYLEFGTSKMRAQPFLRPAFEAKKVEAVARAFKECQDFIRKAVRSFRRGLKKAA